MAIGIYETCGFYQGGGEDLFFYGSHDYDKATIVIVHSEKQKEGYQVSQIASFEPYAWHTAYGDCIDRHQFKETLKKQ